MRGYWLCLPALLLTVAPALGDALQEVPVGHWSYQALDALMQQGLVHGYAAAPRSGPLPLTRMEMAGLVARAVRGIGEATQEQGRRLELAAQVPGEPGSAAPAQSYPPAPAVTLEDLARIEKLLAEFRNELVTLGARVDNITAELEQLKSAMAGARKAVDKLSQEAARHRISGYAQMRYTVDGSAAPESQFAARRAKLQLSGPLSARAAYKVELDAPTQSTSGQSTIILNQGYAALSLKGATLLAGQFYLPFGWELFTPNRDLEAPEESLGVRRLFADQKYDRGVRLEGGLGRHWTGWIALVNGAGFKRGETNDRKDVALRLAHVRGSAEYGLSAYWGKDADPATGADANRNLVGAHVMAARGRAQLKGEVIAGKAAAPGAIAAGAKNVLSWTALGVYSWRPDDRLAVRFNRFDPDRDAANDATDVTSLMWLHQLDEAVRLRIAEDFVRPQAGGDYGIFITELQIVY